MLCAIAFVHPPVALAFVRDRLRFKSRTFEVVVALLKMPIDKPNPVSFDEVLGRFTAEEWILAGLAELGKAREAFASRQSAGAAAALKRAAGMALNGALRVVPRDDWGRTYVAHVVALTEDLAIPSAVRDAARALVAFDPGTTHLAMLRVPSEDARLLEAAKTVMAHAYAIVHGKAGRMAEAPPEIEKLA